MPNRRAFRTLYDMSVTSPETVTVSERLRAETMGEHSDAETRTFITALMGGELSLAHYTRYLAQLAYIYEALEARPVQSGQPEFLYDERLHRFEAICKDLAALGSPDWREAYPALPETLAYVKRISELPLDSYVGYLAHHYTRYLGDLSGGQIIATMVARHYGASEEQTNFYRFENVGKLVQYKRGYRETLDGLDLTADEVADLVAESKQAFALNGALFDALG